MRALRWIWAHRSSCLKLGGLALLATYFWRNPLYVEPAWIGAYLAIVIGVGTAFVMIVDPVIDRLFPDKKVDVDPIGTQIISEAKRRPLRLALLLPGEDGFFFVPLLWVGITPVTAGVATAAFAAAHYPQFPLRTCAVKFVFLFCIAVMVLPHGLGSVVAGHLILDALALVIGGKLFVNTPAAGPRDA
jgi:hypothetical protein